MKQTFAPKTERHERGWGGRGHTLHVPLLSTGEVHQGFFRVPATFGGDEHTNVQHKARQYTVQKVREWVEWKARMGYDLVGKPVVTDPIVSPSERPGAEPEDGDALRVHVQATFVRRVPLKMPLDLFLHKQEEAQRYSVELEQATPMNLLPKPKEEIISDPGLDPLKEAESRRNRLSIRKEVVVEDGVATGANLIYETPSTEAQTVTGESNV
jgi:hypothetical protein